MSFGRKFLLASAVCAAAVGVGSDAFAAKLFKGVAVVLERAPACGKQFRLSESFIFMYLANLPGETTPERMSVMLPNGSLLLTNSDSTPGLNGSGTVAIQGNNFAAPVSISGVTSDFTTSPINASTTLGTLSAVVTQLGIAGCRVKLRGAMTYLPPGGF